MRGALALTALFCLVGCNEAPVVQLQLVSASTLDVTEDIGDLRIGFFELDAMGAPAAAPVVDLAPTQGMLDGRTDLATTGGLEVDQTYVVRVVGTSNLCDREDRKVVGRSLPFLHRSDAYTVPLHVGCAEQFMPTRGQPLARIGHATVALPDGSAVIAGGAARIVEEGGIPQGQGPVENIEVYDPMTGRFGLGEAFPLGRLRPGAIYLEDSEEVVLAGGFVVGGCADTAQVIWPSAGQQVQSMSPLCAPTLIRRRADEDILAIGAFEAPFYQRLAFSPARVTPLSGGVPRTDPQVVQVGEDELLVFGGQPGFPTVERVDLGCTPEPCVSAVTSDVPFPFALDLTSSVGLACPDGGGTAYITGGTAFPFSDPPEACVNGSNDCCDAIDCTAPGDDGRFCIPDVVSPGMGACATYTTPTDVYCYSSAEPDRLRGVGTLRRPLYGHRTLAVGPPAQRQRLLLVGGVSPGMANPEARPIVANACTCEPVEDVAEPLALPIGAAVFDHTVTELADGSILVVGAVDTDSITIGSTNRDAQAYAAIYIPDDEP